MRTNNETENEFEDRIEGTEDDEPGNQNATVKRTVPSKKVSKKPSTPFAVSGAAARMSKTQPKGKYVTSSRPAGKMAKSHGGKARSGKKYKKGGPGKQPPTVMQRMKSFGGM